MCIRDSFQPFQPHDAGDDGVAARRIGGHAFPGGLAAFKHHALGLSGADLGGDAVGAQRSAAAPLPVAQTEFGSADGVGFTTCPLRMTASFWSLTLTTAPSLTMAVGW